MDENIGPTLKQVRRGKGLTLQEVARRARVDPGNLSKLESGNGWNAFSVESLLRIASVYEVPARDILRQAGKTHPTENDAIVAIRAWFQVINRNIQPPGIQMKLAMLDDIFSNEWNDRWHADNRLISEAARIVDSQRAYRPGWMNSPRATKEYIVDLQKRLNFIEGKATQLLDYYSRISEWEISPPIPVEKILVRVFAFRLNRGPLGYKREGSRLMACRAELDSKSRTLTLDCRLDQKQSRFSIAHEIAHLIVGVPYRFANEFASTLLVPRVLIQELRLSDLLDPVYRYQQSEAFCISLATFELRLVQTGLVTHDDIFHSWMPVNERCRIIRSTVEHCEGSQVELSSELVRVGGS